MGDSRSEKDTVTIGIGKLVPVLISEKEQMVLTGKMSAACELVQSVKQEIFDLPVDPELRRFAMLVTELNNKLCRAISFETEINLQAVKHVNRHL